MDEEKKTEQLETPTNEQGKEEKKENNNIPYERFKEVNDRMKQAEAKLQEIEEEKKAKAEEEAIKRGEQDKIIAQKDQEIAKYKEQAKTWQVREEAIKDRNTSRIADLTKKFGDDWDNVKSLVDDITDPFILSSKLDALEKMSSNTGVKAQQGGSKIPGGNNMSRKQELLEKAQSGRLSSGERRELLELSNN